MRQMPHPAAAHGQELVLQASTRSQGLIVAQPRNVVRPAVRRSEAVAWLEAWLASGAVSIMPDSGHWDVEAVATKAEIYEDMVAHFAPREPPVTMSYFYDIMGESFKHVKLPKESRFTKCKTCTVLKCHARKTDNLEERQHVSMKLGGHRRGVMKERMYYYSKRQEARQNPSRCLSMIVDGMDQAKTGLPHAPVSSKGDRGIHVLENGIIGAIVHGHSPEVFMYEVLKVPYVVCHDCHTTPFA